MKAFRESEHFANGVKAGKQAIKGEHRSLLVESGRHKVSASLDFEKAVDALQRDKKRWDYFVECSQAPDSLHAVEVHAFDRSALVQKKADTIAILNELCEPAVRSIKSWRVVVVGDCPRQDIVSRFAADSKIQVGRQLQISKL